MKKEIWKKVLKRVLWILVIVWFVIMMYIQIGEINKEYGAYGVFFVGVVMGAIGALTIRHFINKEYDENFRK